MEIVTKEEFMRNRKFYLDKMKAGKIFVYPTDTIYGLGCDATNDMSIRRLRELKKRDVNPFSVIAPSKDWITENCLVDGNAKNWLAKLPGAYTIILKLKNKEAVNEEVNNGMDSLGVRIPDNWFAYIISELGKPFVTTSVNLSGEKFMISIDNMNKEVKNSVDYIIYTGMLEGRPSTLVKLAEGKEELIQR